MQWGQFIDHDITSTVKSRGFNGSIPKCCEDDGRKSLPREFLVRSTFQIAYKQTNWIFSAFRVFCRSESFSGCFTSTSGLHLETCFLHLDMKMQSRACETSEQSILARGLKNKGASKIKTCLYSVPHRT